MPQNEVVTLPRQQSMEDIEKLAEAVAKSRMFGIQTKDQALVLMAIAQAEGRHPAEAARDYNIIQGRPAKTAEAMMRDLIAAGGKVEWHKLSDDEVDATFSHPAGGKIRIVWDTARAKKAGLDTKDMWRKYPRQMLRSRCVSEGVRTVCPMATSGMYVPEEVRDMPILATADRPADTATDTAPDLDQFASDTSSVTSETVDEETGEITGDLLVDTEPPPERDLLGEARSASLQGVEAFRDYWVGLSAAERKSIRKHLSEFERAAKAADEPFGLPQEA